MQATAALPVRTQAAPKLVVTTSWDDGHPLDLRVAELLSKHGLTGTFYVPRWTGRAVMSNSQISALSRQFEIGAHTLNHIYLDRNPDALVREEIRGSKDWIESITGASCSSFCFPGGKYSARHLRMVREAGFRCARTVELLSRACPTNAGGLYLIPTTVQAKPHPASVYARNGIARFSTSFLRLYGKHSSHDWVQVARTFFQLALESGGVFHLWGHSWEVERDSQWQQLDDVLRWIASDREQWTAAVNADLPRVPSHGKEKLRLAAEASPVAPVAESDSRGSNAAVCDLALSELTSELRTELEGTASANWMSSLSFAEHYSRPGAERIFLSRDAAGTLTGACAYRGESRAFQLKSLRLFGAPSSPETLAALIALQRPDGVIMDLVYPEEIDCCQAAGWTSRARQAGNDYCIDLPATADEYLQSLGTATRKHLPYYLRRLEREWGDDWSIEHASGGEISRASYEALLALNRERMRNHGRTSLWSASLAEYRWPLVHRCGILSSILRSGRVVGGTLSFFHNGEAYLVVIAHDPAHDRLNLGNLCLWTAINHLIEQGICRYHLLWGDSPYKRQFGAVAKPLYQLNLFAPSLRGRVWRALRACDPARYRQAARAIRTLAKGTWWI